MSLREIAEQIWECWEWYPGLGRIMAEYSASLSRAENDARKRFYDWQKANPQR